VVVVVVVVVDAVVVVVDVEDSVDVVDVAPSASQMVRHIARNPSASCPVLILWCVMLLLC